MSNTYYKGDIIPLYCTFTYKDKLINPNKAWVHILHEFNDNIYEDLEWTEMNKYTDGFIYNFDSSELNNPGSYVVVYKTEYDNQILNVMGSFDILIKNIESINAILVYGYVNNIQNGKEIEDCTVQVIDLTNNNIVYQTATNWDGKWEVNIYPGDYEFIFKSNNYNLRTVRAQVGDQTSEIQFNTISLEPVNNNIPGNGSLLIKDEFTANDGMGLLNVKIDIYSQLKLDEILVSTKTDKMGRWEMFLDPGDYLMNITLESGLKKNFRMTVYTDGTKKIDELKVNNTNVVNNIINKQEEIAKKTSGSKEVKDYIQDMHGIGILNAIVKAYEYKNDNWQYVGETVTDQSGEFILYLNPGKVKLAVSCELYKDKEIIINI